MFGPLKALMRRYLKNNFISDKICIYFLNYRFGGLLGFSIQII